MTTHTEISDELCADTNIETTVDDIEVFENNTTYREISDELCVDDNIETTVNNIEVFEKRY